jgi:di/tricarboxylate transporter
MDTSILLVGIVLAATIILLVSNRIRIDLVAILATLSLAWLGLITPAEAISGFASNAVIAMGSVMVLAYGVERTGITSRLAAAIVTYAGTGERRVIAVISGTVGLLSAVIQNIGAAALFLPATRRIGKQTGIHVSRLIMPMGFAAILGGTVTMIASGPLIVVNDLLVQAGEEPFSLFAVTPIGILLLFSGVALFALCGNRILPRREPEEPKLSVADIWGIEHPVRTCSLPASSPLAGKTRDEASFKAWYGLDLLAVRADNEITIAPSRYTRLEGGQELAFIGSSEGFSRFIEESGCIPSEKESRLKKILDGEGYGFAELIVRPRASIAGKTLREIRFRQRFSIEPIVFVRGETESRDYFYDTPLTAGDTIVAFGSWDTLRLLLGHRDLLLLTPPEGEGVREHMGLLAVFIFGASLALALTGVPISLALLTGAAAMILAGVVKADEAYHAVDWRTIVLIAGLIPIGIAMEKSGMATLIAGFLSETLAGVHPIVFLAAFAVLATALSLIISNVAATVLLVPLAMLAGAGVGIDPRALALLVAVSAQNSFILPTHQVNALLMGPGGYSARDYVKPGGILTILFIIIATTLIYLLV